MLISDKKIFQRISIYSISSTETQKQNEQCLSVCYTDDRILSLRVFFFSALNIYIFSLSCCSVFFFPSLKLVCQVELKPSLNEFSFNLVVLAREVELLCLFFLGCVWKQCCSYLYFLLTEPTSRSCTKTYAHFNF